MYISFRQLNIIIFLYMISALFAISLASNQQPLDDQVDYFESSFLWEIRDQGRAVGTLFGSIHMGEEGAKLPEKVNVYLNSSNTVISEIQLLFSTKKEEYEALSAAFTLTYPPAYEPLSARFSPETVPYIAQLLAKQGYPVNYYDSVSNSLILTFLMLDIGEAYSAEYGVESLIKEQLTSKGLQNIALETALDAISAFKDMPPEIAKRMIELGFERQALIHSYHQKLIEYYKRNEPNKFLMLSKEMSIELPYPSIDEAYWQQFESSLLEVRNHLWAEKLEKILRDENSEQGYFVVVGALHLFGEEGLISLLRNQGFELIPIAY